MRPDVFKTRYQHLATTMNNVRPELVPSLIYGHHNSYVVGSTRYWEFESQAGRDRFLEALLDQDCPFVVSKKVYSSRAEAT